VQCDRVAGKVPVTWWRREEWSMSCVVVWVGVWRWSRMSGVHKVMGARGLLESIRSVRERLVEVKCVVGVGWFKLVRSLGWDCVGVVCLVVTVVHVAV